MEKLLFIIIGILLLIIFVLLAKVYFLRKSTKEIAEAFHDRLTADTNTLIDISSRDRHMRTLASEINTQLRLLRNERLRYQQGDLELKEAITNISHDLRTPLTAISGYLDLAEREQTSPEVERYLSQIRNRTTALKSLTDELFRYSVAALSQELNLEDTNLVSILEDSLLSFYALMQEKHISPYVAIPDGPVVRKVDHEALSRIFTNIIENALKYSDGDFSVAMSRNGEITFSNSARELDNVVVMRLFERFYTVETGRNSTGLGLSIAKVLTERMGGKIYAKYELGRLYISVAFL